MKYLAIDIETTGLNKVNCDILQFACVIDDFVTPIEKLPSLVVNCVKPLYCGEPVALAMHAGLITKLAQATVNSKVGDEFYNSVLEIPSYLKAFLMNNLKLSYNDFVKTKFTIAGKNAASFDLPFLQSKISEWQGIQFHHRVMDPSILYFDPRVDEALPSLGECLVRAKIHKEVAHTALEDCLDVICLIRDKLCS